MVFHKVLYLGHCYSIFYMNDLPTFIPNAKIRMYVDDTNLGQRIDDVSDIKQQLIPDFRKLCEWLEINPILTGLLNTRQNRGGAYFTPS